MILKRVLTVLVAAAVLTAATGCSSRNKNNNTNSTPGSDLMSAIEDEFENLTSDMEDDESKFESRLDEEDGEASLAPELESDTDDISHTETEDEVSNTAPPADTDDESAAAAMSTDFTEIGALDAEKKSWGPGGPVDTQNRPEGALSYQGLYGKYGAYFIAPNNNNIYLTFDEGYENGYTSSILDTLKDKNVKAVFFITYDYAKDHADLVNRMVKEGHILGNHSTNHKSFPELSLEDAAKDIQTLHDYVKAQYGYEMTLFRPPMGEFNEQTLALAQSMGYSSVFWSFAYKDWLVDEQPLAIEGLNSITRTCHPGAIYLLHAVSQTNAEILGEAIDLLRGQGYEFARFDWA